jgi:signal transduction histidine kinase
MDYQLVLEKGLLKYFRNFAIIRFLLTALMLIDLFNPKTIDSENIIFIAILFLLDNSFQVFYLFSKYFLNKLKNQYIPMAIVWSTFWTLIESQIILIIADSNLEKPYFSIVFLPLFILIIPLSITSWKYSRKIMFLFCGLTLISDICLNLAFHFVFNTTYIIFGIPIAFFRTIIFLFIGTMISDLMDIQREQNTKIIEANQHLTQYASTLEQLTTTRERNRMARELHDILAHTLSGIAVELEGVRSILRDDPDKSEKLIEHSLEATREGLSETRLALQDLRSSPIKDIGLGLSFSNLVDSYNERKKLNINLKIGENIRQYSTEVQQCFFRIAQEALLNIVDHAKANTIYISLRQKEEKLMLTIKDDGIGFNVNSVDTNNKFGLLGIQERADMIHAVLSITSAPGKGTKIQLEYEDE